MTTADKARAEIGAERDRLLAEARKAAEAEKENLLAQIVAGDREAPRRGRSGDRPGTNSGGTSDHGSSARTLRRDRPAPARAFSVQACLSRIPRWALPGDARLSAEAKAELAAATAADHAIEVVTAAPLSTEEIEHVSAMRSTRRSVRNRRSEFRVDPALIAGIELHGRNTIVRNSWRADLDRIRKELDA